MAEKNQANNNAVISLTVGILSLFIPIMGLLLGIIGIIFARKAAKHINKSNGNGKGLATAGLVCSIVGTISQLLMVLVYASFLFS